MFHATCRVNRLLDLWGMAHRFALLAAAIAGVTSLAPQLPARSSVPRLWTDEALAGWALPIAGVKAAPKYHTEAEYYTAPVDEVRTYPVYIKSREPQGYRDWMRKQGPQPLIEPAKLTSEADWIPPAARSSTVFICAEFRTERDPRAFVWLTISGSRRSPRASREWADDGRTRWRVRRVTRDRGRRHDDPGVRSADRSTTEGS